MILLTSSIGYLFTSLGLGITGSYALLTFLVIIGVVIAMMIMGVPLEVILTLFGFLVLGVGVWETQISMIMLGLVAIVIGTLIVIFFWRLLKSGRGY